jgi:hypothetical protein
MASVGLYGAITLVLLAGAPLHAQSSPASGPSIEVAFVTSAKPSPFEDSALRGARFGEEEARRTAAMMNGRYALRVLTLGTGMTARDRAVLDSASIVVSALSAVDLDRLRSLASRHLIVDLTPVPSPVSCDALLLHLAAPASSLSTAAMWDSHLERFGAQQLNERFVRTTRREMDDAAWLGWFAAKLALELSMRAPSRDVETLAHYARGARGRFDGQKGRPLGFDPRTGILLQPLYDRSVRGTPSEIKGSVALPPCRARAP